MKELIRLYYGIEILEIIEIGNKYQIKAKEGDFLFQKCNRNNDELREIYLIAEELKYKNIPVHSFVLNRDHQLLTKYNNIMFIMLKPEKRIYDEFNIIDIIEFSNNVRLLSEKEKMYKNNWGELWVTKVDYFEYQVRELGFNKKIILNSFSYYVGLAENAISYANSTREKYERTELDRVTLSHKRINFPNESKDYLNPMSFIFDLEVRDIAEYIKNIYFQSPKDAWIELKTYLKLRNMSIYGYQMLFARLLYPSYYFDIYETIMNKEEKEEKILYYIDQSTNYEHFLQEVFLELNKKVPLEKVEWLWK